MKRVTLLIFFSTLAILIMIGLVSYLVTPSRPFVEPIPTPSPVVYYYACETRNMYNDFDVRYFDSIEERLEWISFRPTRRGPLPPPPTPVSGSFILDIHSWYYHQQEIDDELECEPVTEPIDLYEPLLGGCIRSDEVEPPLICFITDGKGCCTVFGTDPLLEPTPTPALAEKAPTMTPWVEIPASWRPVVTLLPDGSFVFPPCPPCPCEGE